MLSTVRWEANDCQNIDMVFPIFRAFYNKHTECSKDEKLTKVTALHTGLVVEMFR